MKICRICGASHADGESRCRVCSTLLPEQIIPDPGGPQTQGAEIKRCGCCGKTNEKTAVRCVNCGAFLGAAERLRESAEPTEETLVLHVSTGEKLQIATSAIIGREYQPQVWDAYAPRAAYRIHPKGNGAYELENLKTNRRTAVRFHEPYLLGRKTFQIEKED